MSRWTWMECIVWVSAIAAISSISRPQSDFLISDQSHLGSLQLRSVVIPPECDEPDDQELLRLSLINLSPKSASESACESFDRHDQQHQENSFSHLGFRVQLIPTQFNTSDDTLREQTPKTTRS